MFPFATAIFTRFSRWKPWAGPFFLFVLTVFLFGDLLFSSQIVSDPRLDGAQQFLGWRHWGFLQVRAGHLPGWNPHIYAGAPYFAELQSALLYPPNLLYLVLPTPRALNCDVALHVFLLGLFVYFWAKSRGIGILGATFSGGVATLSAPHWNHVFAGHLTNLASMAWAPLIFLAADWALKNDKKRAILLGSFALAMQILAGHAQYVYYGLLAVTIYFLGYLARQKNAVLSEKLGKLGVIVGFIVLGTGLAAAQLVPTWAAGREVLRGNGLSFERAATFSLPPESVLSLLTPRFFGVMLENHWGRWYGWETTLFCGVIGLALAIFGAFCASYAKKRGDVALVFGFWILALGVSTPLFPLLFDVLPGYSSFRGPAKWSFFALLFVALLAGGGLDTLARRPEKARVLAQILAILGLTSFGLIVAIQFSRVGGAASWWSAAMNWIGKTTLGGEPQTYLNLATYNDSNFIAAAGLIAARGLFGATIVSFLAAFLATRRHKSRIAVPLLALLGVGELVFFARTTRPTFDPTTDANFAKLGKIQNFLRQNPGDYRILQTYNENSGLLTGAQNLGGNDPFVLRRYAEFVAVTQNRAVQDASQYLNIDRYSPLFSLLRCRLVVGQDQNGEPIFGPVTDKPLASAFLVSNWRVLPDHDALIKALKNPNFDPAREVLLEAAPPWAPSSVPIQGTARVEKSAPDEVILEVQNDRPAILVMTDLWSEGWKVENLASDGQNLKLQPADFILRSLPLTPGRHRLRLFYEIPGLKFGVLMSGVAVLVWLSLAIFGGREMQMGKGA